MRPALVAPDEFAKLKKYADRLSRTYARKGKKLARAAARNLLCTRAAVHMAGGDPLKGLLIGLGLVAQAEALIEQGSQAGRRSGGPKAAAKVRRKWNRRAAKWSRSAKRMNPELSLRAKAQRIADDAGEKRRTVYEALRRHQRRKPPRRKLT